VLPAGNVGYWLAEVDQIWWGLALEAPMNRPAIKYNKINVLFYFIAAFILFYARETRPTIK